jgi:hypothetical protein
MTCPAAEVRQVHAGRDLEAVGHEDEAEQVCRRSSCELAAVQEADGVHDGVSFCTGQRETWDGRISVNVPKSRAKALVLSARIGCLVNGVTDLQESMEKAGRGQDRLLTSRTTIVKMPCQVVANRKRHA